MKMFCLTIGNSLVFVNADYYETCFNNMRFFRVNVDSSCLMVATFPANLIDCICVDEPEIGVLTFKTDFERKDYEE